jgi:hypothetical protein
MPMVPMNVTMKKGEKNHHVHAWWFQVFDQVYTQKKIVVLIFLITILICFNFSLNCYFNSHIELSFQISWSYWIVIVSNFHWIGASILMIVSTCCFNSHNKNTDTIKWFHNIDTKDLKRTYAFSCPYLVGRY